MNYIEQIFSRCNIQQIGSFLLRGGERLDGENRSCYERVKAADEKFLKAVRAVFTDEKLLDKVLSDFYEYASTIEDVHTEIGLQLGFMLAVQLLENKGH